VNVVTGPEPEDVLVGGSPGEGPSTGAALPDEAENPESEGYRVRAGEFEGPLDLLLHLVRINEVDIADIPIVEITRQYQEHLDLMLDLDLDVAGEYVVMASTLMHIKSRMLLPPDPEAAEEGAENDPRAELVEQLLEYQRYKQAAENLSAIDSRRTLIWTREGEVPEEFRGEELLAVDLTDLIVSFKRLLHRLDDEARLRFKRDNVSVGEKIQWLTDLLEEHHSLALLPLLEGLPTRLDRIATFLAMLEMMRLRLILAFQRKLMGEIRLVRRQDVEEIDSGSEITTGTGGPLPDDPRPEHDDAPDAPSEPEGGPEP
jgi:segregation and condensation protein A